MMANEIRPGLDGLYAICFSNDKAYNEKKIREIFGRYGHVVSVRFVSAGERTLVFVRYKEYNEAKHCLDDLNKTNELSVSMAKPSKKFLQDAPKQQTGTFTFPGDNHSSKNEINDWDSIIHKKPFHKNCKHGNGQIRNVHPKPGNCHSENENSSKNIEGTKQSDEISKNEDPVDDKTINRHTELGSDNDTQGTGDTKEKVNDGNRDGKHSGKEDSVNNSDNRGQELQNSHTSNGFIDDGPPLLVASEDLPNHVDEQSKLYAKDVIIANLPPAVDEWDVVCLARKHDLSPVHISAIETTGFKYNIPFCHLWMENDYEAEMAELTLRGAYMEGKMLLVARVEKLLGDNQHLHLHEDH